MDPMWTREVQLSQRKLDPLGLSRVSQWLTEELLPGITTVTSVARNYSFYTWAIADLLATNKITRRSQFASHLTKREAAFVIGTIFHEENRDRGLRPHGFNKASRFINNSKGTEIQVAFSVSESNPEGFYGLYYRTAMYRLGLTIRSRIFDDLTPLGRRLAEAYEHTIKKTRYFKRHAQDERIKKSILVEYGKKACICRLTKRTKERELLRNILFTENLQFLSLKESRKESLVMALSLIKQSCKFGMDFTDDVLRDAVFFGQATDGNTMFSYDFKGFEQIRARWRFFQLHEYFTFALESLLHSLLCELKKTDEGLSFDDFLTRIGDVTSSVSRGLGIPPTESLERAINLVLKKYGLKGLNRDTSHQFDISCDLRKRISEKKLFTRLQYLLETNDIQEIIGTSVGIIILNYMRTFQLLRSVDPIAVWFSDRASQELSPLSFTQDIYGKTSAWKIRDLVHHCFKIVRDQHNLIALDKLMYGNDTFRFEEKGNLLKFRIDVYPNYPSRRSSKIGSVLSILEHLGLVETSRNVARLTKDGAKILESGSYERVN